MIEDMMVPVPVDMKAVVGFANFLIGLWAKVANRNQRRLWKYRALLGERDKSYLQLPACLCVGLVVVVIMRLHLGCICLVFSYIGRPTAASPATGSKVQHLKEQANLLDDATTL